MCFFIFWVFSTCFCLIIIRIFSFIVENFIVVIISINWNRRFVFRLSELTDHYSLVKPFDFSFFRALAIHKLTLGSWSKLPKNLDFSFAIIIPVAERNETIWCGEEATIFYVIAYTRWLTAVVTVHWVFFLLFFFFCKVQICWACSRCFALINKIDAHTLTLSYIIYSPNGGGWEFFSLVCVLPRERFSVCHLMNIIHTGGYSLARAKSATATKWTKHTHASAKKNDETKPNNVCIAILRLCGNNNNCCKWHVHRA